MTRESKDRIELDDLPSLDEIMARIDDGTHRIRDSLGDWTIAGATDARIHWYLSTFDITARAARAILVGLAEVMLRSLKTPDTPSE